MAKAGDIPFRRRKKLDEAAAEDKAATNLTLKQLQDAIKRGVDKQEIKAKEPGEWANILDNRGYINGPNFYASDLKRTPPTQEDGITLQPIPEKPEVEDWRKAVKPGLTPPPKYTGIRAHESAVFARVDGQAGVYNIPRGQYIVQPAGWYEEVTKYPAHAPQETADAPALDNSIDRLYFWSDAVDEARHAKVWNNYGVAKQEQPYHVELLEEANLVGSMTVDGLHAPVIDLDFGAQLIPSTTPGHYHLYLDRQIPWDQYLKVLEALREAGLVEAGFVEGAIRQGFSAVRPPGVVKKVTYTEPGQQLPEIKPPEPTKLEMQLRQKDMEIAALREELEGAYAKITMTKELRHWL